MEVAYDNAILESSCDETVMEVDFVEIKIEKSKKKSVWYLRFYNH